MASVTHPRERIVDLDVTRAIAMIGVVVLNYHGYLVIRGGPLGTDLVDRVFDPWRGPLSTRFAATFVVVAGMGVTLLTNTARRSGDPQAVRDARTLLLRRGLLLFAVGYVLDWVWPGTILFFYGAYLLVAAVLFGLRTRWLVAVGAGAALAAAGLQWWRFERTADGHSTSWLFSESPRSPRSLLFETFVHGTHPALPWLAFLVAGMVLGRALPLDGGQRLRLAASGAMLVVAGYLLRDSADTPLAETLMSLEPGRRSLVYTMSALGSALVAVCLIGWAAERWRERPPVRWLAAAGRTSLTVYVLHVFVFNAVVDWLGWVRPTGLDTALLFAAGFWLVAIAAAAGWTQRFGMGPLERVYRRFGG